MYPYIMNSLYLPISFINNIEVKKCCFNINSLQFYFETFVRPELFKNVKDANSRKGMINV